METKLCCVCYRRFANSEELAEHTQYHGINWQPGYFSRSEDQMEFALRTVYSKTPWGREIR